LRRRATATGTVVDALAARRRARLARPLGAIGILVVVLLGLAAVGNWQGWLPIWSNPFLGAGHRP
jgi:hypothetical protein